jgi:hypothetical protein
MQYCGGQVGEKTLEMLIQDKTVLGIKFVFIGEGIQTECTVHCDHISKTL